MKLLLLPTLFALLVAAPCAGQTSAPAFAPHFVLPGTVRIWGDPAMGSILQAWEERFRVYHPEVRFENHLLGSDTAMGPLYTNTGDLALLGRATTQTEDDGFLHSTQYKPLQLHITSGSLDVPGASPAPVFFVQASNPLDHLSLDQVRRLIGCTSACALKGAPTWGELGLGGAWKSRPIHLYTWDTRTGTGLFLVAATQGPSKKLDWRIVREFADIRRDDGSTLTADEQIIDALRHDPDGLATSTLRFADASVKPLALSLHEADRPVVPTTATVADGTYPLARLTYAFLNRPPGQPVPQPVAEFMRFVLSREGQALVGEHSGFLPLGTQDAAAQSRLLD